MRVMGRRTVGAGLLLPALIAWVVAPGRAAAPPWILANGGIP
jgi:hypothetical protein